MRRFRLVDIYYYFPVFLLGLVASPNIVGWRIGLTIVASLVLAIPVANYISSQVEQFSTRVRRINIADLVTFLLLCIIAYLTYKIGLSYFIIEVLFIILYVFLGTITINSRLKVVISFVVGLVLFSTFYLGLNQYDFQRLLRVELLGFLIISSMLFTTIYHSSIYLGIVATIKEDSTIAKPTRQIVRLLISTIILFILFLWYYYPLEYMILYAVLQIPVLFSLRQAKKSLLTDFSSKSRLKFRVYKEVMALSNVLFLIYFFLKSTQVLQAVMGGY